MQKARSMLWLAASLMPQLAAPQTLDEFFDDSVVQELGIDIRPSDWALLKEHFLENTYYPIDFHWKYKGKDILVPDAGVRSRGHGSRSPVKPNLRLDFNRYNPDQKFLSVSSAVLKANNQDTSMLKERTVFKLFARFGLPASREAHARVSINGEYLGLFLLTEEIRSEYTKYYLGEGSGDLFKFDPIGDGYHFEFPHSCSKPDQVACSADPARWTPEPFNPEENKATYDIGPVIAFIRAINEVSDADFPKTVEKAIDPKLFLAHIAMENYVADFDSILGDVFGMNNFFFYCFVDGTFQFLLWDKDASYDWAGRDIFQNRDQNVLSRRLMAIPQRRTEYLDALYKTVILAGGSGGWLEWEHRKEYQQIREALYADKNKQCSISGVEQPSTNEMFEEQCEKNIGFFSERAAHVFRALAAAGYQPPATVFLAEGATDEAGAPAAIIVPGSVRVLTGSGFGERVLEAPASTPVTTLGDVSVIVNGFNAQILSVSPGRIKLVVPPELGIGNGTAPVTVSVAGPARRGTRTGSPVNGTFSNTIWVSLVDTTQPPPIETGRRPPH